MAKWFDTDSGGRVLVYRDIRAAVNYHPQDDTYSVTLRLKPRFDDPDDATEVAEQMVDSLNNSELTRIAR